jgi:hypothetical protein
MSFKRSWARTAALTAFVATAAMALGASAQASNLIVDGDFSSPNQSGGWNIYVPGTNTWLNTNGDGVEIGYSPIYGLACISKGCQNLEVNANTFDTDSQVVSGLTPGKTYNLSWEYGGRTSGGPDLLDVSFGGVLLTTDSGSVGVWTPNSFNIVATSTTETLTFSSLVTTGSPSYGNEITDVALSATPLPSTWTMLIAGFAGLGFFAYRGTRKNLTAIAAA